MFSAETRVHFKYRRFFRGLLWFALLSTLPLISDTKGPRDLNSDDITFSDNSVYYKSAARGSSPRRPAPYDYDHVKGNSYSAHYYSPAAPGSASSHEEDSLPRTYDDRKKTRPSFVRGRGPLTLNEPFPPSDDEDFYPSGSLGGNFEGASGEGGDLGPFSGDGGNGEVGPDPGAHVVTPHSWVDVVPPTINPTPVYLRATITINNQPYRETLRDQTNYHTRELSDQIILALEDQFGDKLPGQQAVTVISYSPIEREDGRDALLVTLDIGSLGYDNDTGIEETVKDVLKEGRLGRFSVSTEGYSMRYLGTATVTDSMTPPTPPPTRPTRPTRPRPTQTTRPPPTPPSTPAPPKTCLPTEFKCRVKEECIDNRKLCNGFPDCMDRSDEEGCQTGKESKSLCRGDDQALCRDGTCIDRIRKCDGNRDCDDGSDEVDCPGANCPSGQFSCDGYRCLDERKKCDGKFDCVDKMDEFDCLPAKPVACRDDEFRCKSGDCIEYYRRCDEINDCPDAEDESNCLFSCSPQEFRCRDDSCVDLRRRCDRTADCRDGSDELDCPRLVCSSGQFRCDNGSCVDLIRRCDGRYDCPDLSKADERGCTCSSYQWQCDFGFCIDRSLRCNGQVDCPKDDSDERACPPPVKDCKDDQFRCPDGRCIPGEDVCNGRKECSDGADERVCPCKSGQFECTNGFCIDTRRKCDGFADCQDRSDEANCAGRCEDTQFRCGDMTCIDKTKRCDGKYDCYDGLDEADCKPVQCRRSEFRCPSGVCLNMAKRCNGLNDCPQGEDEANCGTCPSNKFRCQDGICIDVGLLCNGFRDCFDGSDETNCEPAKARCNGTDYICPDGTCIDQKRKCDGKYDCIDGSDETICLRCRSGAEFTCNDGRCIDVKKRCDSRNDCILEEDEVDCPVACRSNQFKCRSGQCIDITNRCNKEYDCIDGSDEFDCGGTCRPDQWRCLDGLCIALTAQCDGRVDCRDFSDEADCDCKSTQFQCQNRKCIDLSLKCNQKNDCADGSDERNCVVDCSWDQFRCSQTECISSSKRCDGRIDCSNSADEANCVIECTRGQFRCQNGDCINKIMHCNGRYDCRDGSDEVNCVIECSADQFRCLSGECIVRGSKCDGRYDCKDRSDEADCVRTCRPDQFRCLNGDCIDSRLKCNKRDECRDGSDEINCAYSCETHQYQCRNGDCIESTQRCDSKLDCFDGSDESDCIVFCARNEFECAVDGKCIEETLRCDGYYDCVDFSDEQGCDTRLCRLSQFRCGSGLCIDRGHYCDGVPECPDRSDEAFCWICQSGQFFCANGQCVEMNQRCDGRFDCSDLSDEADCTPVSNVNIKVYPERQSIRQGQEVVFRCRDEGARRAPVKWSRSDGRDLPLGSKDLKGRLTMPDIKLEDSGTYLCAALGVPPGNAGAQKPAVLTVQPLLPPITPPTTTTPAPLRPPGGCSKDQVTCRNGECIAREYACDGDFDCTDGSDEQNCAFRCQPNEYQCENQKCILKIWRCDGEKDCKDGSDEKNCEPSAPGSPCRYDEYECLAGDQCIPKSYQCDAQFDCQDKSDEIGCAPPTVVQPPPETVAATEGDTVNISCRAVGNPMPIISWRLNWHHIPTPPRVTTTSNNGYGTVTIKDVRVSDQGAWSCEAINNKDSVLAPHDAILSVKSKAGICLPPSFNDKAQSPSDCLRCFCFGVTDVCYSSNLRVTNMPLRTEIKVVALRKDYTGNYTDMGKNYPPNQGAIQYNSASREYKIDGEIMAENTPDDVFYFWSLPPEFLGNHLFSYGGFLRYIFRFREQHRPRPLRLADVIIGGNGITLYHVLKPMYQPLQDNSIEVRFWEGEWHKSEAQLRGEQPMTDMTTREDLMTVLQNVQFIYVRASYDHYLVESSILNLEMDTALLANTSALEQAVFVEKCSCTEGYTGSSCEECAVGYNRQYTGTNLGRCVTVSSSCKCNGHSTECDQRSNECRNCQHNTEGRYCEKCSRGFYGDATRGYSDACKACPCPFITPSNQFSPTCYLEADGDVTCEACPLGFEGRRCERCAPGYEGDPTGPGGACEPRGACQNGEFRCSTGNATCINIRLRCDGQANCPDLSDENGCACEVDQFRCFDGTCVDAKQRCDGRVDCYDYSDEANCVQSVQCDPIGSLTTYPSRTTGLCQCKPFVTGARCDQCKVNSFHLSPDSPNGCIDCFCMGVTKSCTSSARYRDTISLSFTTGPGGVTLTSLQRTHNIDHNLRVDHRTRDLVFRDFSLHPKMTFYWNLPSAFLGNKITAYGGRLNFTIKYEQGLLSAPNTDPDVQISGNGRALIYKHNERLRSGFSVPISVPMLETSWLQQNGQPTTREYLMMILADLDYLIIKATYSSDTISASISEVTLQVAVDSFSSYYPGSIQISDYSKAMSVEQCRCPVGYQGLSCEDCVTGYTRSGREPFLGMCVPCFCNGHSSDCDPDTGVCNNCQHNTKSNFCEECATGHVGDATRGTPNDCRPTVETPCQCDSRGSRSQECDFHQNCECKEHAEGRNCDRCKDGHFNLEEAHPQGCSQCFCSSVTNHCMGSSYYRDQIKMRLQELPDPFGHNFQLTDRYRANTFTEGIVVNPSKNEVSFSMFNKAAESETLFWSLPEHFLGNKLTSYGGQLKYGQQYVAKDEGDLYADADIEIIGNGITIFYVNSPTLEPGESRSFEVHLKEDKWQRVDTGGAPRAATREDFLRVLSHVEALLIRASFHQKMSQTVLRDVIMDTAVPQRTGQPLASLVEQCVCPPGYIGLSCEECAPGYIRDFNGPAYGRCTRCNCNGHSETCDPNSGQCLRCRHNTVGDNCQRCADGFYGDATRGTPEDCKACPCPLTVASNQFSQTCYQDTDGQPTCNGCPMGYSGRNCEKCASGYRGNPVQSGGKCEASSTGGQTIRVRIEEPKIQRLPAGAGVTFRCSGISQVSDLTYNLVWTKEGGSLPSRSSEASGILTISDIRAEDSGVYVCTGSDLQSVSQNHATLIVDGFDQKASPRVRIDPRYQTVKLGDLVEFRCFAEGYPPPDIRWHGGRNNMVNSADSSNGLFKINSAKKSDEAEYFCTATNSAGTDTMRTVLFVEGDEPTGQGAKPYVTIAPSNYEGRKGETVRFDCRVSGTPAPDIEWTFSNGPLPVVANVVGGLLTLPLVNEGHQGTYICTASNIHGSTQSQARLTLETGRAIPTARIEPERQTVIQGRSGELRCVTSGNPPPTVTWLKIGGELTSRNRIEGEAMTIEDAMVEDRGLYVCRAENREGSAQGSAIVEIERREVPAIELYPEASQVVVRGGSALFQCRILAGIPSPTVEWTRADGSPFTSSTEILNGGVIRFNRVTGDEDGTYICTAENIAGRVTAQALLRIQGAPAVKILQGNPYRVRPGEQVKFECNAEGEPRPNVVWRKHRQPFVSYASPVAATEGKAVLEIPVSSLADSGVYICAATNSAGTAEERIHLIVEEIRENIPGVVIEDRVVTVPLGSKAEVRCFVRGTDRKVTLEWRKEGGALPATSRVENGVMYINNVMPQDAGEYTCAGIVEGDIILFQDRVRLAIVAPPRIQLHPPRQTARPGDNLYIDCIASGDPQTTIDWSKIGGQLPPRVVQSGTRLEFRGIAYTDAGRYLCTAVNAAGKAEGVAEVIVDEDSLPRGVLRKEETAFVGSNIELRCQFSGSPPPKIVWSFDGSSLPNNCREIDNVLWIKSVRLDNAGRYICSATSPLGTLTRDYVMLNVRESPTRFPAPSTCQPDQFQCRDRTCISSQMRCNRRRECPDSSDEENCPTIPQLDVKIFPSKEVVHMGDSLTLQCHVSGDPTARLEWSKINQPGPFPDNVKVRNNVLTINGVKSENGGVYRCSVDSYAGNFNDDYVLAIQVTPTLDVDAVETRSAPFGSTVVLDCQTNLEPPLGYTWTKQGASLPDNADITGSVLTLKDIRGNDGGTYICSARNRQTTIDIPTILVVTGIVPHFKQSPLSYMTMPTLPDTYQSFEVELSLRPDHPNGLILYNGQQAYTGDFISLGLREGFVEFRFELGGGVVTLRSENPLDMGKWSTIRITRDRKDGILVVDKQPEVTGSAPGQFVGLDLLEPLYIGAVPDFGAISKMSGFYEGFVGCISKFRIGTTDHQLIKEATSHAIKVCPTCEASPCLHSGICQEALEPNGYKCICASGFSGSDCEKVGEACYPGVCGEGRCVNKPGGGFDCYCPFGRSGLRCEQDIVIIEPSLSDDAFIAYPTPRNALTSFNMGMKLKPKKIEKDGILMYSGQAEDGAGDFTALTIKNKSVEFRFDTGSGPAIIRSPDMIFPDEWVTITANREFNEGTLTVGNGKPVKGRAPGHTRGLNLRLPLFIGGYDKDKVTISSSVGVEHGFEGCIGHIEVNGSPIDLVNQVIDSANVEDCGSHAPCQRSPCKNGGTCTEADHSFQCQCALGFTGKTCEAEQSMCDISDPCKNEGLCFPTTNSYKCCCAFGYMGDTCETSEPFIQSPNEGVVSVSFEGDGFAMLPSNLLPHHSYEDHEVIKISFTTTSSHGVLLFHGQNPDTDANGRDFLVVALVDGFIEFSWELGSGPSQIRSGTRVNDGKAHRVVLLRKGIEGSLKLDDLQPKVGSSQGTLTMLNTEGDIYVGGVPDPAMTGNRYPNNFVGCIFDLEVQSPTIIDFSNKQVVKTSCNLHPCNAENLMKMFLGPSPS